MNATCMSDQTSLDQYCDERDLRKVPNYYVRMMKPRVDVSKAFDPFRIDDPSFMDCYEGRSRCFKCGQSRKYFCYTCYLPLEHFKLKTPTVEVSMVLVEVNMSNLKYMPCLLVNRRRYNIAFVGSFFISGRSLKVCMLLQNRLT